MKKLFAALFLPLFSFCAEYEFLTPQTAVIKDFKGSRMFRVGWWRKENGLLRDRKGQMTLEKQFDLEPDLREKTISVVAADVLGNRYACVLKP